MKKKWKHQNNGKSFQCEIKVRFNCDYDEKVITNGFTHDDVLKKIWLHSVEAKVDGYSIHKESFSDLSTLEQHITDAEDRIFRYAQASSTPDELTKWRKLLLEKGFE